MEKGSLGSTKVSLKNEALSITGKAVGIAAITANVIARTTRSRIRAAVFILKDLILSPLPGPPKQSRGGPPRDPDQ